MRTERVWAKSCCGQLTSWALFLVLCLTGCAVPISKVDTAQERLDSATPPLNGTYVARQSFVCSRPNLYQIELLPAIYEMPGQGTLSLFLYDPLAERREVAQQSIDVTQVRHNEPLQFTFSSQRDSAGKAYELQVEGSPGVQIGLWFSSVNAYGAGELGLQGSVASGDLRFITRCRYFPMALISDLGGLFSRLFAHEATKATLAVISLALLLLVPGYLLKRSLASVQSTDPVVHLAWSLSLSLAVVPVVLLWSTTLGLRWDPTLCWVAYAVLSICALTLLLRVRMGGRQVSLHKFGHSPAVWVIALLALTLLWRFVQIRDLVLPAWVDSPQHVLVTELVASQGQVPRSYQPLLPVPYFIYHFGFHANLAVFGWLSGLPIPQGMLTLGQVLNAACGLTAYLWTVRLTGRRLAGAVAVVIVGFMSYMPAYYVSWGRYTQLTGMLLLPTSLVAAMNWLEMEPRNYRLLFLAGLLQAGMFLTHTRVAIFGICFLVAYVITETLFRRKGACTGKGAELWARWGALCLMELVLIGPWLVQLSSGVSTAHRIAGTTLQGDPSYNAFPRELLWVPHNRELLILAALGALWSLLNRKRETVWVLFGCGLVALITNPGILGLPNTNVLNNATAVIALFLPVSLLGCQAVVALWDNFLRLISRLNVRWGSRPAILAWGQPALLAIFFAAALWGMWGTVNIVNPITVLAAVEDLTAMEWIVHNTPEDAVFLINSRHWQLGSFTGTDAGYWIPRLTGRQTSLPEIPYAYGAPQYVQGITDVAQAVSAAHEKEDAQLVEAVRLAKATHIYIGAQAGPMTPQMFVDNPGYRPAYNSGAVWIFTVVR
jgi:hypothetical protein